MDGWIKFIHQWDLPGLASFFKFPVCSLFQPAGTQKTQSPNSTTLSLKKLAASTSLLAAQMMLGTLTMRRMKTSAGHPSRLPLRLQARTSRLCTTRYLQDLLFLTEKPQAGLERWQILIQVCSAHFCVHLATPASDGWNRACVASHTDSTQGRGSQLPKGWRLRVWACQRQICEV